MASRFLQLAEKDRRPDFGTQVKQVQQSVIRDNFSIFTWLLLGASLEVLLLLAVPMKYAVLPPVSCLLYRIISTIVAAQGYTRNRQLDGVVRGKFSAQVPAIKGATQSEPSEGVAVILLATRSNHALGILGPGYKKVGQYMSDMLEQLESSTDEYGYLGQTTWIEASGRAASNQVMVAAYFRSLEDIHRYAHSPLHRNAWHWWNTITKEHPHLSIMHEVYHAPKGHWENIYINNHLVGISGMRAMAQTANGERPPIVDASEGSMRTQLGRLGRSDGSDNDRMTQDL